MPWQKKGQHSPSQTIEQANIYPSELLRDQYLGYRDIKDLHPHIILKDYINQGNYALQ